MDVQVKPHNGIIAMGVFLFFGATMAFLAGATLVWRGTILDRAWAIHAAAHARLLPFGKTAGILFLLLGGILVVAGAGWWKRRLWRWGIAVAIIVTQVLGDLVSECFARRRRRRGCWVRHRWRSAILSSPPGGPICSCEWQCLKGWLTNSSRGTATRSHLRVAPGSHSCSDPVVTGGSQGPDGLTPDLRSRVFLRVRV